jgi:hypothetical protein
MTTRPRVQYKCPHCGFLYSPSRFVGGWNLVPSHAFPEASQDVCPGSKQTPRNPLSDHRPLWKDGGVQ